MPDSVYPYHGKDGDSWYYRIELPRDPVTGKRRQHTKRGFASEQAAREAMQAEIVDRRRGQHVDPSREPLGVYLDRWRDATAHRRRPITTYGYGVALARLPASLVRTPLAQLTPLAIQEAQTRLLTRYAASTVRHTHQTLDMALRQAVRWKLLSANPCEGVDPPRVPRRVLTVWTAHEARAFLASAYAADDPDCYLWRLLLDSGLRIGEALALRWQDVDLETQTIHVTRTLTRDGEGRTVMGEHPKTSAGRRLVPISHETARELGVHRGAQARQRRAAGRLWREQGLVFAAADGQVRDDSEIRRHLELATARADVPRLSPHGLRHTCATLLILAGVPVKVVSERLGHSSVSVTLDRYVHPDADAGRQAADTLARLLSGAE